MKYYHIRVEYVESRPIPNCIEATMTREWIFDDESTFRATLEAVRREPRSPNGETTITAWIREIV